MRNGDEICVQIQRGSILLYIYLAKHSSDAPLNDANNNALWFPPQLDGKDRQVDKY